MALVLPVFGPVISLFPRLLSAGSALVPFPLLFQRLFLHSTPRPVNRLYFTGRGWGTPVDCTPVVRHKTKGRLRSRQLTAAGRRPKAQCRQGDGSELGLFGAAAKMVESNVDDLD
jgi:hypothetical protein